MPACDRCSRHCNADAIDGFGYYAWLKEHIREVRLTELRSFSANDDYSTDAFDEDDAELEAHILALAKRAREAHAKAMARWRGVGKSIGLLLLLQQEAACRLYAPGAHGYHDAKASFDALVMDAQRGAPVGADPPL